MSRLDSYLMEAEKKDKKEKDDISLKDVDGSGIPVNNKGERDYTGTGVKADDAWKTPEQREQDKVDGVATKKEQERSMIDAEKEKLQQRHDLIRTKLGRILATPDEIEELDDEREDQEELDAKKEELRIENKSSKLGEALDPKKPIKKKVIPDKTPKKVPVKKEPIKKPSNTSLKPHEKAVQQATSMGLHHVSRGRWADKSGNIKGAIIDDKFVASKEDEPKKQSNGKTSTTNKPLPTGTQKRETTPSKSKIVPSIISKTKVKEIAKKEFEQELEKKKKEKEQKIKQELDKLSGKTKEKIGDKPTIGIKTKYPTKFNDKDKTLNDTIDTSKQKAFTTTLYDPKKGDDTFYKSTKNYNGRDISIKDKWSAPSWLDTSGKVPKREVQIFTRMLNTKSISSTEPPISYFTNGGAGGAGKIQAQAGELMTMIFTSLSQKEKSILEKSIKEHIDKQDEKTSIVTKDWLKAAINNSDAIHNRIQKEFGVDDASKIITHTCWDTKDDVEALGLNDYNKNKGFSSDIYIKLKLPNGQKVLNEVSLKKDKNVFLLNSSTGKLKEWDKNLPSDIDPNVYAAKLSKSLTSNVDKNKINRLLASSGIPEVKELKDLLSKNKADSIDKFMTGNNRTSRKILLYALKAQAANGDEKSAKELKKLDSSSHQYSIDVIKAIGSNKTLKKGMLDEVKKEFPLKSVTENEETMAIGDMSVDKKVIYDIFGTSDWNEIQEHLDAITDKDPPYLAYKVKGKKETIPIAIINVREDGVNYGASFKFEMSLDKRFAKRLKESNMKIYGSENVHESAFCTFILKYDLEDFMDD